MAGRYLTSKLSQNCGYFNVKSKLNHSEAEYSVTTLLFTHLINPQKSQSHEKVNQIKMVSVTFFTGPFELNHNSLLSPPVEVCHLRGMQVVTVLVSQLHHERALPKFKLPELWLTE